MALEAILQAAVNWPQSAKFVLVSINRVPEPAPIVPRGTLSVIQELEHQQATRPVHRAPRSVREDVLHHREIAEVRDIFIRTIGKF